MKKLTMTYRELHEKISNDPSLEYFVKTPSGYAQIRDTIKKISDTYEVSFSNNYSMIVGDKHAFMNSIGNAVTAESLCPSDSVMTIDNSLLTVESKTFIGKDKEVFDISIDSPHWYTNSIKNGGIIHHNTNTGLVLVKAYMDKHPDAVCLFYDSEFGLTPDYLSSLDIDIDRVIHTPITTIEELKFDIMNQLETLERNDKAIIFIDSIGNLASRKETEDALDQKSKADMTRAKQLKSLWRMVTPKLTMKNITCININHVYDSMEMYSKKIVSGGTGGILSSNIIWIISKAKEKDGKELSGYKFTINIEKSRLVKEGVKFPFTVTYKEGVSKWSGLLDFAVASGHVIRTGNRYQRAHIEEDKKHWAKETNSHEFWDTVINDTDFNDVLENTLVLGKTKLMDFEETETQLLLEEDE